MSDNDPKSSDADMSISGRAIALALSENDSLATVLHESGMELRDFIVLSFISDQGPIDTDRLVRLIGIDRDTTLRSIERLINLGFLVSDVLATDNGNRVAQQILSQL